MAIAAGWQCVIDAALAAVHAGAVRGAPWAWCSLPLVVCSWLGVDVVCNVFDWLWFASGSDCECVCVLLLLWFAIDLIAFTGVVGTTLVAITSFTVVESVWWLTCTSAVHVVACGCDCKCVELSMRIGVAGVVHLGVVAILDVLPTVGFVPHWSAWSSLSAVVDGCRCSCAIVCGGCLCLVVGVVVVVVFDGGIVVCARAVGVWWDGCCRNAHIGLNPR